MSPLPPFQHSAIAQVDVDRHRARGHVLAEVTTRRHTDTYWDAGTWYSARWTCSCGVFGVVREAEHRQHARDASENAWDMHAATTLPAGAQLQREVERLRAHNVPRLGNRPVVRVTQLQHDVLLADPRAYRDACLRVLGVVPDLVVVR